MKGVLNGIGMNLYTHFLMTRYMMGQSGAKVKTLNLLV